MNKLTLSIRPVAFLSFVCIAILAATLVGKRALAEEPLPQSIELFDYLQDSDTELAAKDIARHKTSDINLPTGRLIVYDGATVVSKTNAFTLHAKPGIYPVYIYGYKRDRDIGLAMSEVRFSAEPAVRWKRAVSLEKFVLPAEESARLFMSADAGLGNFLSTEALGKLAHLGKSGDDLGLYISRFEHEGFGELAPLGIIFPINNPRNEGKRTLPDGYDSNPYPSYFGLGADGNPVTLVTTYLNLEKNL